jgi:hypothetical protein
MNVKGVMLFIERRFHEASTGGGVATLLGTLLGAINHTMTWQTAFPLLLAGIIGVLWPESGDGKGVTEQPVTHPAPHDPAWAVEMPR